MKILTLPLSLLYGFFVRLRNLLYDQKWLKSYSPDIPTICIGNLAVGGTGKTPHVEFLVRELTAEGLQIAVLSRGYKRKKKGFVLADATATAEQIGDEPAQMKQKFPQLIVAVCEDRVEGVKQLQQRFPNLQCILLDDAFQHRRLKAGLRILLTPADRLYTEDHLLPWGRLREHAQGSRRANIILVTKCPEQLCPRDKRLIQTRLHILPYQSLYFSRLSYGSLIPVFDTPKNTSSVSQKPLMNATKVLMLAGIAQPQYLERYLLDCGKYEQVVPLVFADHHAFTVKDMAQLTTLYQQEKCSIIITTEKDAVRLRDCSFFPDELKKSIFYIPIQVDLGEKKTIFIKNLLKYVKESNRNR